MTESLPGRATPVGPQRTAKGPLINAIAGFTLRSLPRIPNAVKRLLLGGCSVTIDGNTLDTTMQLMLAGMTATGLNRLVASPDVAAARGQLGVVAASFRQDIPVASVTNFFVPGLQGPIGARHYRPFDGDGRPLLVFYHGGGQVIGNLDTHDDLCRQICRDARLHVVSVDYRLAPEHKAPAGSDDAYATFQWSLDHAGELGADSQRVAVGGDSAGGNLAASVSQRARNEGGRLPALQFLLYPIVDYTAETRSKTLFAEGFFLTKWDLDFCRHQFLDGAQLNAGDPQVSPLLADDLSGLPPALLLSAGFDPLRDEDRRYADALRKAGVPVDHREFGSLIHGFANFSPLGGDSAIAMAEIISALRAHVARA